MAKKGEMKNANEEKGEDIGGGKKKRRRKEDEEEVEEGKGEEDE